MKRIPTRRILLAASLCFSWLGLLARGPVAQTLDLAITPGEDTVISGVTGTDHEIFARQTGGGWTKLAASLSAALPPEAEIDAISFQSPTNIRFSLDSDVILSGTAYADEDVIFWNGSTVSMAWDGSANGLPAEVDLDALEVTVVSPFTMVFSLNSDALLTIGGTPNTAVADEDLMTFVTGSGITAITFDGSAEGVPAEADLDAVDRPSATTYLFSFDVPAVIGALTFDDADIVQWDSVSTNFSASLFFTASGQGVLPEVDLGAVETSNLNNATPTPSPTASPTPSRTPTPTASPTPSPTPFDDASFGVHNMPATIPASHGVPFRVTVLNAGNTIWTPGAGYALAVVTDSCGLSSSNRLSLAGGSSVAPGVSYQFEALLLVPAGLGPCTFEVRMVQDGGLGLFGPTLTLTPVIVTAVNNAVVVSDTIPPTLAPNQGVLVGITMRNTGNTPWYSGSNYALAPIGSPCMIPTATRYYVLPGDIVMPNQQYQFLAYITAPGSTNPSCNIQFQMVEEFVAFFGQVLSKNINVANPPNAVDDWTLYE